jgi:hypothetical protein
MQPQLPEFEKRAKAKVIPLVTAIFSQHMIELVQHEDGHFRVMFTDGVFTMGEGQSEPTQSQWSTLKKRFKRRDKRLFIFKEHGGVASDSKQGETATTPHYYLDFGFFRYE